MTGQGRDGKVTGIVSALKKLIDDRIPTKPMAMVGLTLATCLGMLGWMLRADREDRRRDFDRLELAIREGSTLNAQAVREGLRLVDSRLDTIQGQADSMSGFAEWIKGLVSGRLRCPACQCPPCPAAPPCPAPVISVPGAQPPKTNGKKTTPQSFLHFQTP